MGADVEIGGLRTLVMMNIENNVSLDQYDS
jgi:hypothetical protein